MTGLTPRLVLGENNKVCMQLTLGQWSATRELPDHMATWEEPQLQTYFNQIVPDMAKELYRLRRQDRRRLKKKAEK